MKLTSVVLTSGALGWLAVLLVYLAFEPVRGSTTWTVLMGMSVLVAATAIGPSLRKGLPLRKTSCVGAFLLMMALGFVQLVSKHSMIEFSTLARLQIGLELVVLGIYFRDQPSTRHGPVVPSAERRDPSELAG